MVWPAYCQRRRYFEYTNTQWTEWIESLPEAGFGRFSKAGWQAWFQRMLEVHGPYKCLGDPPPRHLVDAIVRIIDDGLRDITAHPEEVDDFKDSLAHPQSPEEARWNAAILKRFNELYFSKVYIVEPLGQLLT